jgi:hypothetical protein
MNTPLLTYTVHDGGRAERGYKGETDDCAVKSVAIALKKPYEAVHQAFRSRGRRNGRGTPTTITRHYLAAFPEVREMTDIPAKRTTFWRFFHAHQKGTFLIIVTKHLTVIQDGVVLDEIPPRPRMLVRGAWQVMLTEDWSDYVI